ncbi:MAG: flagellar assembly protein FliW [Deltaproteobacteria bacterium]|nr:flagellar assembly protein FliW [Deltaproteobacteria bacterium]
MKVTTSRFGEIELQEENILTVPSGLIGFPEIKKVAILDHKPGSPFRWLQSIDQPDLAFVIVDPLLVAPLYPMDIVLDLFEEPGTTLDNLAVACIATVPPNPEPITVNLLAPVAFNADTRNGAQVVIPGGRYSSRYLLHRNPVVPPVTAEEPQEAQSAQES